LSFRGARSASPESMLTPRLRLAAFAEKISQARSSLILREWPTAARAVVMDSGPAPFRRIPE
jgi:hypothetical protein